MFSLFARRVGLSQEGESSNRKGRSIRWRQATQNRARSLKMTRVFLGAEKRGAVRRGAVERIPPCRWTNNEARSKSM